MDQEPEYFPIDRLVGIFSVEHYDDQEEKYTLVELVHLTSRFGAFIRKDSKWQNIWPVWGIDPNFKYLNFEEKFYHKIVDHFDNSKPYSIDFSQLQMFQEVQIWEGEYDFTENPNFMRDIGELINWVQDFVEPRPIVFKNWGNFGPDFGDMADAAGRLEYLEWLRKQAENRVMQLRKQSSTILQEEKLQVIQMYPPIHESLMNIYCEVSNHALVRDMQDEFDFEKSTSEFENYLQGGTATITSLTSLYLEFLLIYSKYNSSVSKGLLDDYALHRDAYLKPENRLEMWFRESDDKAFHCLMASTIFGNYQRIGKNKWRQYAPGPEETTVVDLVGIKIIHVRPEKVLEVFETFDSGKLEHLSSESEELNQYQVVYNNDLNGEDSGYVRTEYNSAQKIKFADLDEFSNLLITNMFNEYKKYFQFLQQEGENIDDFTPAFDSLEAFTRSGVEFRYKDLHNFLGQAFQETFYGEDVESIAKQAYRNNLTRNEYLEMIETRSIDYFVNCGMTILMALSPEIRIWLQFKSNHYGNYSRQNGKWQSNMMPDLKKYPNIQIYDVREESVGEIISFYDLLSVSSSRTSFSVISPMLCKYSIPKGTDPSDVDPNSWDKGLFTFDDLPNSLKILFKHFYGMSTTFLSKLDEDAPEITEEGEGAEEAEILEMHASLLEIEKIEQFANAQGKLNRYYLKNFFLQASKIRNE